MSGFSTNRQEIEKKVRASMQRFEGNLTVKIEILCLEIDRYIKSLTPVHTGETVRNYIWSTDVPFLGHFDAIDNGPTGNTNSMTLGEEPRRGPNEHAAAESLALVNFSNPFQSFYLANNSPQVAGLELGILPGPPMTSRSPHGMFGLTHEYVMIKIRSQGFS